MRYYLDTNILVFLITGQRDEIHPDVAEKIFDYANQMLTSSVCVHELVHLNQIGKFEPYKRVSVPSPPEVLAWLNEINIEVVTVSKRHIQCFSELPMQPEHRDPNDRIVIAQAIADRIPLVSSDRKFDWYKRHGLEFVFNDR